MIAAPPTVAAEAATAAAPFNTSRRFTSIASSLESRCAPRATGDTALSEAKHRDAVNHRRCERVPQGSPAEPQPEDENESGSDQADEEPVASRGRKAQDADPARFLPVDREHGENDERQRHEAEEQRRLPSPRHPREHCGAPLNAAKGEALGDVIAHEPD